MKTFPKNKIITPQPYWGIRAVWTVLALFASAMAGWGQTVIIDQFNSSAEVNNYDNQAWNGSPATLTLSAQYPSYSTGSSGSMQMNIAFGPGTNGPGLVDESSPFPISLANATYLEFDLMVDPSSALDPSGDAYYFQIGFQTSSYAYEQVTGFSLGPGGTNFTAGVWQHFKVPIPSSISSASGNYIGLVIDQYDSSYSTAATTITYIDNIQVDETPPALPHYPNYVGFTFDNSNSVTTDSAIAGSAWYGQPTTIAWATNNSTIASTNITPVAGSGSAYITATFAGSSDVDNSDIIGLAFDTNYFVDGFPASESNTNDIINGYQYDAVEFDILWDTNNSTMPLDEFNAMGDIFGAPVGLFANGNAQVELSTTDPSIPEAASNGWVHMVVPIPSSTAGIGQVVGLWLKKYGADGTNDYAGTAAYWIDNVVFDGAVEVPPSPQMTLTPAVKGLNTLAANGAYDRESLVTYNANYSWVEQSAPVTYSFNIAQFPGAAYAGFDARLYLVPNPDASEADPDYQEANLAMIQVYLNANGLASVGVLVKTNAPNGNGNLYSQDVYWNSTNSPATGNWSFTFTDDTNILITAPDGETGNVVFPLDDTDLQNLFGTALVVYVGGFDNGSANQGQDMVYGSIGITNGGTQLLYDDFATDTTINPSEWIVESSGAPGNVYLTSPTTVYLLDWTAPANGFFVQTNADLLNNSEWSTNDPLSPVNLGSYYQATVDVTNLPPNGPLFFRLNDNPTQ